jgi:3-dehydroquinate dehydratase/shikimate dehydrogenase
MTSHKPVRICVPICQPNLTAMEVAARVAESSADLIELRLDCLGPSDDEEFARHINQLVRGLALPVIITFRPTEEGGYRDLSDETRTNFWKSQSVHTEATWWDVEAAFLDRLPFLPDWSRIVCSHHDFSGVPVDLADIYQRLASTQARIVKIAVQARDAVDCLPIFDLIKRARGEGREIIAIAMGAAGAATRILGPSRGAYLTYGPVEIERATAPGQVSADALRSVYRIDRLHEETQVCGLVGLPVMHSVSPHMHNAAFEAEGIDGVYIPFEVRDVETFFRRMVHPGTREIEWRLRGLSVTAPHKVAVMKCLDWIDDHARDVGAVNTIVVAENRLLGYNTDTEGLLAPLRGIMGSFSDIRVAVIGAGGVARAAAWALHNNKSTVTVFARDAAKARVLASEFGIASGDLTTANFADFDVVINATPLGGIGELRNETPVTAKQLSGVRLVYDLVYNPVETTLLREARSAGCEVLGGLHMLVAQANIQFKLWTGRIPSSSLMYDSAALALTLSIH